MPPFYADLTFWMYFVAGLPFALFVGFYAIRTPTWKRTAVGRALMTQSSALAATFYYICLLLAVNVPEDVKQVLRSLLIGGVTIGGALMFKNLLVEQSRQNGESPHPLRRSTDYP
jgi:hypothetical protein